VAQIPDKVFRTERGRKTQKVCGVRLAHEESEQPMGETPGGQKKLPVARVEGGRKKVSLKKGLAVG